MDERGDAPRDRRRFWVALMVFAAWVAALGVTAVVSGRRPAQRAAAPDSR